MPLGLVLLLALLWTIYWLMASGSAKSRFAEERARLAEQGLELSCSAEEWGGYPFHFEYTCRSPVATYRHDTSVRSGSLLLVALAYAPWQVAVLVDGPTILSGSKLALQEITHQRAFSSITFGKTEQPASSTEVPGLIVPGLGRAGMLMIHTRPSSTGGTDMAVSLTAGSYEPIGKPPVRIDSGTVMATLTPDPTLRIDSFELKQGELRYWGSGSLSLDQDRRIAGQINTETNDIKALLGIVGPQLDLSEGKTSNLVTMLGLLGSTAKAPIIAKDGVLYLGPFRIAELKPLY